MNDDPSRCPTCGKLLSPAWRDRCEHCRTPYTPELVASREAAHLAVPRGPDEPITTKKQWLVVVVGGSFVYLVVGFITLAVIPSRSFNDLVGLGVLAALIVASLVLGKGVGLRGAGSYLLAAG